MVITQYHTSPCCTTGTPHHMQYHPPQEGKVWRRLKPQITLHEESEWCVCPVHHKSCRPALKGQLVVLIMFVCLRTDLIMEHCGHPCNSKNLHRSVLRIGGFTVVTSHSWKQPILVMRRWSLIRSVVGVSKIITATSGGCNYFAAQAAIIKIITSLVVNLHLLLGEG